MYIVKPSSEIIEIMGAYGDEGVGRDALSLIERAGRTCYKSEDKITEDSMIEFVKKLNNLGHESVLEHSAMMVKFICDRGVSHELVRHRMAAYSQESTRYCNYKGGVTFIIPPWVDLIGGEYKIETEFIKSDFDPADYQWLVHMLSSEKAYTNLIAKGWTPQQARAVLPNSTKTEIIVTANFREWRHIFKLRCSKAAHPQMREIMCPLLYDVKRLIPVVFDDITY